MNVDCELMDSNVQVYDWNQPCSPSLYSYDIWLGQQKPSLVSTSLSRISAVPVTSAQQKCGSATLMLSQGFCCPGHILCQNSNFVFFTLSSLFVWTVTINIAKNQKWKEVVGALVSRNGKMMGTMDFCDYDVTICDVMRPLPWKWYWQWIGPQPTTHKAIM